MQSIDAFPASSHRGDSAKKSPFVEFEISEPLRVGDVIGGLKELLKLPSPSVAVDYLGLKLRLGVSETPDTFAFDNTHEDAADDLIEVVVDKNGRVVEVFDSRIN